MATYFECLNPENRVEAADTGNAFVQLFSQDWRSPSVRLFVAGEQLLGGIYMPIGEGGGLFVYDVRTLTPLHWYTLTEGKAAVLLSSDPDEIRKAEEAASKSCRVNGSASLVRLVSTMETIS